MKLGIRVLWEWSTHTPTLALCHVPFFNFSRTLSVKLQGAPSCDQTRVKIWVFLVSDQDVRGAKFATDPNHDPAFLARWLTSARAYRIGGQKLCPSVCLYVKRYLLLQFCTDYNQTWINMMWAVAAKTLLSQIFHKWRKIEVNCVYISRCAQLVSYFWNAGMHTK